MPTVLRFARLLSLIVWVGALTFFGAVAYIAFTRLPSTHDAGLVVGGSLRVLHEMGLVCGTVLIATSISLARTRRAVIFSAITAVMLALTAYSQYSILPRMEVDRLAAGGDVPMGCASALCADFDHLHHISEHTEDLVLLGGLALTVMLASE
jgi:hypothetical protein